MISKLHPNLLIPSESLEAYINQRVQINQEIKAAISSVCKEEEFSKGQLVLKQDKVAQKLYFIEKGSARTFYYHDGKDITSWIYRDGQLLTSWSSFLSQTPSFENLEIVEDAKLCSISFTDLHQLYEQYPKMMAFGRIMLEEQIIFLDYFYKAYLFITAREKYDLLLSIFPDVTQRVNLGHIASYLGVSQETLSRIRKKK